MESQDIAFISLIAVSTTTVCYALSKMKKIERKEKRRLRMCRPYSLEQKINQVSKAEEGEEKCLSLQPPDESSSESSPEPNMSSASSSDDESLCKSSDSHDSDPLRLQMERLMNKVTSTMNKYSEITMEGNKNATALTGFNYFLSIIPENKRSEVILKVNEVLIDAVKESLAEH